MAQASDDPPFIALGNSRLDVAGQSISAPRGDVRLQPGPFALLMALARQPGAIVTHAALLAAVHPGADASCAEATVKTLAHRLRTLLDSLGCSIRIQSQRGVGYVLTIRPGRRQDAADATRVAA